MSPEEQLEAAAETLENAAATLRSLVAPYAAHYPAERLVNVRRRLLTTEADLARLTAYWPEQKRMTRPPTSPQDAAEGQAGERSGEGDG